MLKVRIIFAQRLKAPHGRYQEQKWGKFEITMRHRGKARTTDIPLSSAAIETLALEAMSRDLAPAELVGQILVSAINKDMVHKILRD
jgi:hypothetical protein